MQKGAPQKQTLKRDLGLWTAILLVMSNTLSGSAFVLLSDGAGVAGLLLPLSFILGGVLAFLISIIYAEVATSIPEAGASLSYSFSAYGRGVIPFILTWLSLIGNIAYGAINAIAFGIYLTVFFTIPPLVTALAVVFLFSLVNTQGIKELGSAGKWSATILLLLLGVFLFLILGETDFSLQRTTNLFESFFPNFFGIFAGTALIFSAFIGFEGVSSLAREIKDPDKNIPKALFWVIGITTVIYVFLAFVVVSFLPVDKLAESEAPLSLLAKSVGSEVGNIVIVVAALLASGAALLMDILVSSRKVYAATEQGFFPSILKKVTKKGVPVFSVLVVGVAIGFLILTNSISFIAYLGNSAYLLFAGMLAMGVILMRKKRPYLKRPFRTPFFPLVPIATIVLALLVILASGINALFWLFVWILFGFLIYLSSFLEKNRLVWVFAGILFTGIVSSLFLFQAIVW